MKCDMALLDRRKPGAPPQGMEAAPTYVDEHSTQCLQRVNTARRIAVGWVAVLLFGCTEGAPSKATGSTDCPNDACVPWPTGSPAQQGAEREPNIDEVLDAETADETTTVVIDATGASVTLSDGFNVAVPGGALPSGTLVTIRRYAFTGAPLDSASDFYRIDSPVQPTSDVALTFPIPGDLTRVVPDRTYAMWHGVATDGKPELEALPGSVDVTAGTLTVPVAHFSAGQAFNDGAIDALDATPRDVVTDAPYYNQGETQNCWSVALTMLLRAYGGGGVKNTLAAPRMQPWENNAFFGLSSEHGLTPHAFMSGRKIVDRVAATVPGAKVERRSWWTSLGSDSLKRYVDATLRERRPIMMWFQRQEFADGHMLLLLGIEGSTYVVHDPAVQGYAEKTWAELEEGLAFGWLPDGTHTLALTGPAGPLRQRASVGIKDAEKPLTGVTFMPRRDGKLVRDDLVAFRWYLEAPRSHGLANSAGAPTGTTKEMRGFLYADFTTNERDGDTRVDLGYEVEDASGSIVYASPKKASTAPFPGAWAVERVSPAGGVDVGTLVRGPGAYTLRLFVERDGQREDEAALPLVVEGAPTMLADPPCPTPPLVFPSGATYVLRSSEFDTATGAPKTPRAFYSRCDSYGPSCALAVSWLCRWELSGTPSETLQVRYGLWPPDADPGKTCAEVRADLDQPGVGGILASSTHYAFGNRLSPTSAPFVGTDVAANTAYADTELGKYVESLSAYARRCP